MCDPTRLYIGRDSIINTGSTIDHDCDIDDYSHIAPGCVHSGGVTVGNGRHISTVTSVVQNISIGNNSVLAAVSVIYKDILGSVTIVQIN